MKLKVLLICNAGMSTSLLMNKMKDYASSADIDLEVEAHPIAEVIDYGSDFDVILLGPQVRFNLKKIQGQFPDKAVETINVQDYGLMNGKNVVLQALKLVGQA